MSRSRRPEKIAGEFGSRRLAGWPIANKATKRLTHKAERRHAEREIDESINLALEDDKQQPESEPHEEFHFEDYSYLDEEWGEYNEEYLDDLRSDDYFFPECFW